MFPAVCGSQEINDALTELSKMKCRGTLLDDDHPRETWREAAVPPSSSLAQFAFDATTIQQIQAEFGAIRSTLFWANLYRVGEYIPRHKDTDGDLQLILPIVLPPIGCGGRLVIHHQNVAYTVAERVGQRLILRATETVHETTKLVDCPHHPNPMRIVCVCRIFL
jgi:hypothetical protein